MNKIQRVSIVLRWMFQIAFIALPLLLIAFWMNAPLPLSSNMAKFGFVISFIPKGTKVLHALSANMKVLGFLISLIPLSVELFVLYFLIRLFKLFELNEIFSYQNVRNIKYIAYALFVGQLISPIYQMLISAAMTWHNPVGKRMMAITFTGSNIAILLIALMMILISWIMSEAYKLREEQKYTV